MEKSAAETTIDGLDGRTVEDDGFVTVHYTGRVRLDGTAAGEATDLSTPALGQSESGCMTLQSNRMIRIRGRGWLSDSLIDVELALSWHSRLRAAAARGERCTLTTLSGLAGSVPAEEVPALVRDLEHVLSVA